MTAGWPRLAPPTRCSFDSCPTTVTPSQRYRIRIRLKLGEPARATPTVDNRSTTREASPGVRGRGRRLMGRRPPRARGRSALAGGGPRPPGGDDRPPAMPRVASRGARREKLAPRSIPFNACAA
eukprot:14931131-Alexandrium_andersonii.AAC.1